MVFGRKVLSRLDPAQGSFQILGKPLTICDTRSRRRAWDCTDENSCVAVLQALLPRVGGRFLTHPFTLGRSDRAVHAVREEAAAGDTGSRVQIDDVEHLAGRAREGDAVGVGRHEVGGDAATG